MADTPAVESVPAGAAAPDRATEGTVYLLHFDRAIGVARHYLGWAGNLDVRLSAHRAGRGGRATRALIRKGGTFEVTGTWAGSRSLEARLRKRGPRRLCPLCR